MLGVMSEMDGTPGRPTPIDAALLMMRFLYAALLVSVGVYVVVVHVIPMPAGPETRPPPDDMLRLMLAGVAAVLGLGAPFARRLLMPARAPVSVAGAAPTPTHISPGGFARAFTAHIVAWAMCEAVTVIGVVLFFLTRDPTVLYPFAAAAVLLVLVLAPRRSELEAVARAEAGG